MSIRLSEMPLTPELTLADLRPAPYNPRSITPETIEALKRSLGEFGDLGSITWNRRTGNLIGGHQRMEALRQQHGESLRVEQLDQSLACIVTPAGEKHLVRIVDWDEAKEKAANLAANNPHLQGDWDDEKLAAMLEELKGIDPGLFANMRFDDLEADIRGTIAREGLTDPDEQPEPPEEPISRSGDLWLLGRHRLLCGDSTKPEDVGRLMGKHRAVLMATDPPYGVSYTNDERPNPGVAKPRVAKPRVANDTMKDDELQAFLEASFKTAASLSLRKNAAWYLWHAHLTQGFFAAAAAAAAARVVLHRQIIWVKPVLLLGRGQYHWKHEPCFFGWVEGHQPPDYGEGGGERTQTTVWEVASVTHAERKEFNHSTPKPVKLFSIPIVKHSKRDEIVYEPFAGSGPQFIAAEQLERRCFGLELSPAYCDVIKTRWENFTGKKATLAPNG